MDSAHAALATLAKNDPRRFKKLCGDAKLLANSPPFRRIMDFLSEVCAEDELAFVPVPGATQIDPLLAALREGSRIPLGVLRRLERAGRRLELDGDGVVSEHTPEPYHATEE